MAVEQTVICDGEKCGKPIEGNHFELSFYTRIEDPNAEDVLYENGILHFHPECFDAMRDVLNIDNPQTAYLEEVKTRKEEQAKAEAEAEALNQEAVERNARAELDRQRADADAKEVEKRQQQAAEREAAEEEAKSKE